MKIAGSWCILQRILERGSMLRNNIVSMALPIILIIISFIPKTYKNWVFIKFGMYRYLIIVPMFCLILAMLWRDDRPLIPIMALISVFAIYWDWRTMIKIKNDVK